MGNTETKVVVRTEYVESEESIKAGIIYKLENQLAELKEEVQKVEKVFQKDVRAEVKKVEGATILRYNQLQDITNIQQGIETIFKGFPALNVVVDAAKNMIGAINATEKLTEIVGWQKQTKIKCVGDKVYGLEMHYKIRVFEEKKWMSSKETVVLVAYKAIASTMNLNPGDFPDEEDYEALKF